MTAALKRIAQPRASEEGGRVVTTIRLKPTTWLLVQMLADTKGISVSRLLAELVEREIHGKAI